MSEEWEIENDPKVFNLDGYFCVIYRNPFTKSLLGYVGIPKGHPYFGSHYGKIDINCHGELSYSGCDIAHTGINPRNEYYFIRFDCCHIGLGDLIPCHVLAMMGMNNDKPVCRNVNFVRKEIFKIVDQLNNVANSAASH